MKRIQWRIEQLAYGLLESCVRLLPGSWAFRLGESLAGMVWPFLRKRRRSILRNLRIAFSDRRSQESLEELARQTFRRTGANLLGAAHTARLKPEQLAGVIDFEGWDLYRQASAKGRGVVLLLSHMGNWELLSRVIHLLPEGTRTGAFYRPLNNPIMDAKVLARREADGTRMFSKREPFHRACRFLRDGGVLGILADQRAGWQGKVSPFFGRLTRCSPLPSLLARRTGSELLAFSLRCTRPGHWCGTFLPVASAALEDGLAALEQAMSLSPEDVFWLQERWRCYVRYDRGFVKWLGDDGQQGEKPHRALLWVGQVAADWTLPAAWLHPDVRYERVVESTRWTGPEEIQATPRHAVPNPASITPWLQSVDAAEDLPLDVVVAVRATPALARACRVLGITFVALD